MKINKLLGRQVMNICFYLDRGTSYTRLFNRQNRELMEIHAGMKK